MNNNEYKIGLVAFSDNPAGTIPLSNLINIITNLSTNSHCIIVEPKTAQNNIVRRNFKIDVTKVNHVQGHFPFNRVFSYIISQIKISFHIFRLKARVDTWFFFLGDGLLIPIMIGKLLRKNVVLIFGGSVEKEAEISKQTLYKIICQIKKLNCSLVTNIIVYSDILIDSWGLSRHREKIVVAPQHYIDFQKFKSNEKFNEKNNLVGFIGRFSQEKGILNLLEAIPGILEIKPDTTFLIIGNGPLSKIVENSPVLLEHQAQIKLIGWTKHDDLPYYMNQLKVIVIPSYTEGLPNVMLEAMACGAAVLATPVGSIPDFIKDGVTGFITENNSSECISRNVLRVLGEPRLEIISNNGHKLVENDFTFDKVVNRYTKLLESYRVSLHR